MTIEDIAAKYNFTYAGNVVKNKDGTEKIGCLHLTEDELTKEGWKGDWVISFEEGLDVLFNQGASIFFDIFDKETEQFMTEWLISKGFPLNRIY